MTLRIRAAAVILLAASIAGPAFCAGARSRHLQEPSARMCHGADGLAATPMGKNMKILSFKAPEMVKASDAQFIASTKDGKGKMPAYKGKLTDAQIKDVIAYIRTLQK